MDTNVDFTALGIGRLFLGLASAMGQHETLQKLQQAQILSLQKEIEELNKKVKELEQLRSNK